MARKLSEYKENLAKAIQELNETRGRDALLVVTDGLALTKRRVIDTGKTNDGGKFSGYSRRILPWHWFGSSYGKDGIKSLDFNVGTAVAKLKKAYPKGASYFDWRKITGRNSPFKNFSFDNQMWASIRAVIIKSSPSSVTVQVNSSIKKFNDVIIPAHNNREGRNILETSEDERRLIYTAFTNRRLAVLRKHGILK